MTDEGREELDVQDPVEELAELRSAFDDVANETSDFGAGGWPRAVI